MRIATKKSKDLDENLSTGEGSLSTSNGDSINWTTVIKKLLKEFSYQEILNSLNNDYFEYVLIKGLVIANCEVSYIERLKLTILAWS